MNSDRILQTLNEHRVGYILIGGMNFLLRYAPAPVSRTSKARCLELQRAKLAAMRQ